MVLFEKYIELQYTIYVDIYLYYVKLLVRLCDFSNSTSFDFVEKRIFVLLNISSIYISMPGFIIEKYKISI